MEKKRSFRMSLQALSAVHVGSGAVFSQLDYVLDGDRVLLLDFDRLLEAAPRGILNDLTEDIRTRFEDNIWRGEVKEFFARYELDWREFVREGKDLIGDIGQQELRRFQHTGGHPYLPGSSLKGAIRTAVLYRILSKDKSLREGLAGNVKQFGNDRKIQKLLGENPFRDLFRCLKVGDSGPVETKFASGAVYHLEKEKLGTSLAYEVADGVQTRFPLRIDAKLAETGQIRTDHFDLSPEKIREACNDFAAAVIEYERDAFDRVTDPKIRKVKTFYNSLREELEDLGPGEFLLRVGQGSGKVSTSLFLALKDVEGLREEFTGGEGKLEVFTFDQENDKRPGQGFTFTEEGKGVAMDGDAEKTAKPGERWLCEVAGEIETMIFVNPVREVEKDEEVDLETSDFYPKTRKLVTEGGVAYSPLGWVKISFGGDEDEEESFD